jgi:MYXO-CTERM domain-containing protein
LAEAFTAGWNAHDPDGVLACFAPDAIVRERWGTVPPEVWDSHDAQVVRKYLEDSHGGDTYDTGGLTWASGQEEIAAWAAARLAQLDRFVVVGYRATGDTVTWQYQEFVDPFQRMPGIGPTEGTAEAVVHDGAIAVLTLVRSSASVRRQRAEAAASFDRAMATRGADTVRDGPGGRLRSPRSSGTTAEPTWAAWPLALGGLALLGALVSVRRRRPR